MALATLVRGLGDRFRVTLVGTDRVIVDEIAAARSSADTCIVRPVRNKWDLRGSLSHLNAIRQLRPAVLHANLRHPWSCQYALSAGLLTAGVRTVAVQHAILPPRRRRQVWLNRLNLTRLDAHIAVSRASARMVERAARLGQGSVQVIYNGVPDIRVRERSRVTSGTVIGYVGRLSREKGVDVLIRALSTLPEASAVLVGDGPDRQSLESLAGDLGLATRVTFAGWQADPRPWYAGFDVFALPSRSEGLGTAAVEALLAECPVVASRVGGTPEVVIEGQTGFLVPPEDVEALAGSLAVLLGDAERRRRMGARGREFALERFGLDRMLRSYERVYDELVDGGRSE